MESEIYNHPEYYEIAFGFVDAGKSVDLMESFIHEFSHMPVERILDICCGPSLQLREFARRGYQAVGLDCSPQMLEYLGHKAREESLRIELVNGDMCEFDLNQPVDFCCNMMGSICYVRSTKRLRSHLASVARALKPGGLYLIENMLVDWASPDLWSPATWDTQRDGISVRTTYQLEMISALDQTALEKLRLAVDDHGRRSELAEQIEVKLMFPQELRSIVEAQGAFEFVGFFERNSTRRLEKLSSDNITLPRMC